MDRFSNRTPHDQRPNRIAAVRSRIGVPSHDLTVSNPTICSLAYPEDLLRPLADRAGREYHPDPNGPIQARTEIAAQYQRWQVHVPPDNVVLTASTSEAYSFLFKLLAEPGESVLVPSPSYPLFDHLARLDAVRSITYPLVPDDGWRPDLTVIDEAPDSCRAVVVVHPNNPTGSFIHPEDAEKLVDRCSQRGWALIADEVFLPYPLRSVPGAQHTFAATSNCLTFTLGGFSKSIGLPQVKLGWITVSGPDRTVHAALERLEYIADAYLSVSGPVALAAPALLARGAPVHDAIHARCTANLQHFLRLSTAHPSVSLIPPDGGWSTVIRIPSVTDDEDLAVRLLEEHGVAVHPGYFFDLPGDGHLVVSLLPPEGVFVEGIRRLLACIDTLV